MTKKAKKKVKRAPKVKAPELKPFDWPTFIHHLRDDDSYSICDGAIDQIQRAYERSIGLVPDELRKGQIFRNGAGLVVRICQDHDNDWFCEQVKDAEDLEDSTFGDRKDLYAWLRGRAYVKVAENLVEFLAAGEKIT